MAVVALTPTGTAFLSASPVSSNVAIPSSGTPTTAQITNTGEQVAYVALGTSNAVVATINGGTAVAPGQSVLLAIGANTFVAGVTLTRRVGLSMTFGT